MVLFDGVQSLDVTGPLEVFAGANSWRAGHGQDPLYDIRTASLAGQTVRTSSGLRLAPDEDLRADGGPDPDVLIVPGGEGARHGIWSSLPGCGRTAVVRITSFPCARARSSSPKPGCSTDGG